MESVNSQPQENSKDNNNAAGKSAQQAGAGYYSSGSNGDGRIMLGQDIEIFPDRPLPELAGYETKAFEAKDKRQPGEHFAMLCGRHTVPRVTSIASYKNIKSPNIMRLLDSSIVFWPPENRQRFTLVFEKPNGRKLMGPNDAKPYRFSEDRVIHTLIQPIVYLLAELRNADIVHGAINPENLYVTGAPGSEVVMLGECISCAPSLRQHAQFETIERGMAHPSGRGSGTQKDDLYSFGMCVAMAVRGENLMAGKTEKQIIYDKLENSSYGSIVGRERMPAGVAEFLRGVLNDDETLRWDVEDAIAWLEGRRLSPKQPRINITAARPYLFKEHKFWDLRSLAMAFSDDPMEAVNSIEKDHFDAWLKRNFEDKHLLQRLEKAWEREKGGPKDRMITGLTMALDPKAPVRYKGISCYPGGFGMMLADAMAKGEDTHNHAEVLQHQLLNNWMNQHLDDNSDGTGIMSNLERSRNYIAQKIPGYGMERVLYTLNKEAACMSPLLKNHYVLGAGSMLRALESVATQSNRPDSIFDRHMLAFLSVREPKTIDPFLALITSQDRGAQLIGLARALAGIQKSFGINDIPQVGNWLISMINPAVNRFNDRDFRQEISKRLNKLVDSGNMTAILELIDDPRIVQEDANRFKNARKEFFKLVRERLELEANMTKKKNFGYATGRQVAMLVSSVIGVAGMLTYIIARLSGGL